GVDYIAKSGTLTFAPGVTTQTISVTIKSDTLTELDETFFINLSNPVGAGIQDPTAVGVISNATLQVAAASAPAGLVTSLTENELAPIVLEAKALWTEALGVGDTRFATLNDVNIQVGNLPQGVLGETIGHTITIDSSAAGWGWFVDRT